MIIESSTPSETVINVGKEKIVIKTHGHYRIIEIGGNEMSMYKVTFRNDIDSLTLQTVDGSMRILPSVSNEIRISTNK